MTMTRAIAFASMTAVFGGVVPSAALAAVMPPLSKPSPAAGTELPPPLPSSVAPAASWYVVIDGAPVGPLTDAQVIARLDAGDITGETLVWQAGMKDWQTAGQAMPLVAKRVEAALKQPKLPARKDGLFTVGH